MQRPFVSTFLGCALALLACRAPSVDSVTASGPEPTLASSKSAAPAAPGDIEWGDRIAWLDWNTALRAAQAENKPLCVVVYADWCPRCKELAPVFSSPEIVSAAQQLVMVRQDQDEHPPWLEQRLGKQGSYVPRVFFLDAQGQLREDLQSGHPRYPYFYAPMVSDQLLANMRAASRR